VHPLLSVHLSQLHEKEDEMDIKQKLRCCWDNHSRILLQSGILLILSLLALGALLLTLGKLHISYSFSPTAKLIVLLPEEYIAELSVLLQRMKKAKASPWEIRLRFLTEFLTLLWVFYIQIKFENLWLPSDNHEIDD
jgi:hypothetical protein